MRALLDVVLESGIEDQGAFERQMDAQKSLDQLGLRAGIPTSGLLESVAGGTFSLQELRRIKDLAKRFLADAKISVHERAAAQLLYNAAIAAALCVNGTEISAVPIDDNRDTYQRLGVRFAGTPLGEMFARAAAWKATR